MSNRNSRNSGLSDEAVETIRRYSREQRLSNRNSQQKQTRLIDELEQKLLIGNNNNSFSQ